MIGCHIMPIEYFIEHEKDLREAASLEGLKSARFWKQNSEWISKLLKEITIASKRS